MVPDVAAGTATTAAWVWDREEGGGEGCSLTPETLPKGRVSPPDTQKMKYWKQIGAALIIAVSFLMLSSATVLAEQEVPEGYDENTEITIRGTLTELLPRERGPVIIRLRTDSKTYLIVTAPPRYLFHEHIVFRTGSTIEVRGAKYFSNDGNLYIISREIRLDTGNVITLRDRNCNPIWRRGERHRW
ncbi:MAG: hypothetical protein HGA78_10520 [Nitrospirales bacterium]|nr:hypothetical protein [Nitrospirales bacterium]